MPSPDTQGQSKRRTRLGLLLIMVVSLALRLGAIDHGMPANHVPDTHMVRSALGMAKDKTLVPEVGTYSTYPNLLPYMLLPIYGAQYGVGRLTGAWSDAAEFRDHALEHPEDVHLPARILVALLSSLLPLVAFGTARAMGMNLGAWVAAWLAATGLLGVHFSMQERPWEPMVLFMLLAAWPAASYVTGRSRRALVLSCAAVGLAFATHQAGAAALLIPGTAWLLVAFGRGRELKRLMLDGVLAVACFCLVGLVLGHPYLLIHGSTATEAVVMGEQLEQVSGAVSIGGQGYVMSLRPASFARLAMALLGYDPVLLLLGLGGFLVAWSRRCLWPVLAFLLVWGVMFLMGSNDHVRYLLPLTGLLALPAGLLIEGYWANADGSLRSSSLARAALALLLLFPLVQAMRLAHVLGHPDVRAAATATLTEPGELPPGTRVAIDRYGPRVPLSLASLERLAEIRDLGAREAHRLGRLAAPGEKPIDRGVDAVYIEDYFAFDDRAGTVTSSAPGFEAMAPGEVLKRLGVTHVVLVDKTPGDGQVSLLEPHLSGLVPLSLWSPGATDGGNFEARLPTELDFALTSIWRVERPGPMLHFYRLLGER